jgi:Short C-terminal domain/Phospholipase_D-nuclease N-terminal
LFLLFRVIMDVFRDDSLSGFAKALWLIFVILLPFLGVFIYVIVRGSEMGKRDLAQAQASEEAFRSYVQQAAASGGGTADELAKLADLRQRGVISDAEFEQQKAKMLA